LLERGGSCWTGGAFTMITSNCKCVTKITRNYDGASEEGDCLQKRLQVDQEFSSLLAVEHSVTRESFSNYRSGC